MSSLFRKEVLDKKRGHVEGDVFLAIPLPLTITVMGFFSFVIIALLLAFNFEYAQKRTLTGIVQMSPDNWTATSYKKGVISELYVDNKSHVNEGDVLAIIRYDQTNGQGEDVSLNSIELLNKSQESGRKKLKVDQKEVVLKMAALRNEQSLTVEKILSQENRVALVTKQLEIEKDILSGIGKAYRSNDISKTEYSQKEKTVISIERELEQERSGLIIIKQRSYDIESELERLELQNERLILNMESEERSVQERIDSLRFQHESSIVSTMSGTVHGLTKGKGEYLEAGQHLLTIAPDGADVYIDLLAPSSLSSVIELDDEVQVYVSAYPYQENGFLHAKVSLINPNIIMPSDNSYDVEVREPSYLVRLKLMGMTTSIGRKLELRSGMAVSADVITHRQKVIDWALSPLNDIKEKY